MNMLDERAKFLLKTLVERYIADGQPVASRTLSKTSGIELIIPLSLSAWYYRKIHSCSAGDRIAKVFYFSFRLCRKR